MTESGWEGPLEFQWRVSGQVSSFRRLTHRQSNRVYVTAVNMEPPELNADPVDVVKNLNISLIEDKDETLVSREDSLLQIGPRGWW